MITIEGKYLNIVTMKSERKQQIYEVCGHFDETESTYYQTYCGNPCDSSDRSHVWALTQGKIALNKDGSYQS